MRLGTIQSCSTTLECVMESADFSVITGSRMLFLHDASDSLTYSSMMKSDDWEHPTATVNTRDLITSYR